MFTVKIYFLTKNLTASVPHICAIRVGNSGSFPGVGRKKRIFQRFSRVVEDRLRLEKFSSRNFRSSVNLLSNQNEKK